MMLTDVNGLVYASDRHFDDHPRYRHWLEQEIAKPGPFALSELVLSGFLRIVTNPRLPKNPMPVEAAIHFTDYLRGHANCVLIHPGPRHCDIFTDLCRHTSARGNTVPDAYLAAMAIESGCEWITADRGFGQFPGLRWRHPLGV